MGGATGVYVNKEMEIKINKHIFEKTVDFIYFLLYNNREINGIYFFPEAII